VSRTRESSHLAGLDGVRGVAILLVIASHFPGPGHSLGGGVGTRLLVKAASYGLLGVDLFFVLSGFLITGLLLEAKGRTDYFRNFYARRTLRIFPLYYFVLALLFLVWPRLATPSPMLAEAAEHQAWLWTYTTNFYVAARASWDSLTYVTHFWSLAIEEHFYLFWPLVVFVFSRRVLERICLGVMATALALRIGLALGDVNQIAITVLTPCRMDALCIGGLMALLVRRPGGMEAWIGRSGRVALLAGGAVVCLSALGASTQLGHPVLHEVRTSLYALFFAGLTLMSLKPATNLVARALQGTVLRFLGKYSYGLYVYHGLLHWYFRETGMPARLLAAIGHPLLAVLANFALGLTLSVFAAVLSYQLLEKRFLVLKRYFEAPDAVPPTAESLPDSLQARRTSLPPRWTAQL
jgi:peptidoglycan/LPS O-acetylase OafA/YrhL